MTLGQASGRYLGNLKGSQRELAASEINRFVRHVGPTKDVTQITKLQVERYQQFLVDTAGEAASRVEASKSASASSHASSPTESIAVSRSSRIARPVTQKVVESSVMQSVARGRARRLAVVEDLETIAPAVREDLAAAYQDRLSRGTRRTAGQAAHGRSQGQIDR